MFGRKIQLPGQGTQVFLNLIQPTAFPFSDKTYLLNRQELLSR